MKKGFLFLALFVVVLSCTGFVTSRTKVFKRCAENDYNNVEVKYFLRVVGGHEYLTTVAVAPQTSGHGVNGTNVSVSTIHSESCPCHKGKKLKEEKKDYDFNF